MAADFMPQVRAEAWKVYQRAPHALELDELVSLGLLGLAQATNKWAWYCDKNGYDPDATQFFIAYVLRRVKGAMLDALRAQDWVTRSARTRAKVLRDAGQDLGLDEETLARRAGLTVDEVRETMAAVAARPVSLDAEPHDVAAHAGTESQAVVSSVLEEAAATLAQQPAKAQALVMLRYYYGKTLAEAAQVVEVTEEEAVRLHRDAILAVHNSMVRAVS
jgi:RNA polymerase sigma factor for flagellar operon FliA